MLYATWIHSAAAAAVIYVVARDRAEHGRTSDKVNVRRAGRECCHAASDVANPGVQDKATVEVILAVVCCKILLFGRKIFRIPKTGRGGYSVKRVSLVIQRAGQDKTVGTQLMRGGK
ncbi:hypothetical protein CORC01_01894 [Colletotrichum orchidophilum]|uniref:Uncharacterized protein n=1 Tax=Colletotrichum orchidophilum TaxID=1209926 RepID=A0A1G4BNC7_9PEZI|nr:uncharacterized protein CORC01_01894 [Colletotrichum orchidophilum]OHF02793.1 hypothetical protein CORC01_01894 [Colletotrichum orchidophilum]